MQRIKLKSFKVFKKSLPVYNENKKNKSKKTYWQIHLFEWLLNLPCNTIQQTQVMKFEKYILKVGFSRVSRVWFFHFKGPKKTIKFSRVSRIFSRAEKKSRAFQGFQGSLATLLKALHHDHLIVFLFYCLSKKPGIIFLPFFFFIL